MYKEIKNNIVLYNYALKVFNMKKNRVFNRHIKTVSKIDSIRDFEQFAQAVQPFVDGKIPVVYSAYGEESYYYGYYNELMNYAGVKLPSVPVFPKMEHGVRFGESKWVLEKTALAYAGQSRTRANEIWEQDPDKMVFELGPYIHYAREYYDEETFRALKKEYGKVLLVFPSHTAEGVDDRLNEESFVETVYRKYKPSFDTVMVCAYWRDASTPVITEFKRRGAKIVSAGYRGDINFIRRLKTIIRLSDAVVGDDLGTNIGFCLYMNRPYYLESVNEVRGISAYYKNNQERFHNAFFTQTLSFTQEQLAAQKELYREFWGGNEALYSKEDAQRLVYTVLKIYRKANYRVDRLGDVVKDLLTSLPKTQPEYKMLRNAVKLREDCRYEK